MRVVQDSLSTLARPLDVDQEDQALHLVLPDVGELKVPITHSLHVPPFLPRCPGQGWEQQGEPQMHQEVRLEHSCFTC